MTQTSPLSHGLKGALIALAVGVASGYLLRPTHAETSEPPVQQLLVLKPSEAATFDGWDNRLHH
ncbi:hypothetical protein [Phenylobacterium sp.]|uniref:hypothetical protein n=1 Tax=Phenylobacterium sp. TaxID=1871053 RepID=UPI00286D6696|nr:hypothetical protein [Phenylobacterium sp.]